MTDNEGTATELTSWRGAAIDLLRDPRRMVTYLLLIALIVSVVVRFTLPGEFWAILGGAVTGGAQAQMEKRRKS